MTFRPHITINGQDLALADVDLVELANRFGTPLYVTDEDRIRQRYREFRDAFQALYPKVQVCYAYKANSSLAVLHILRQEGAGADILSEGELFLAQKTGVPPEKVIFTGNNKTDGELEVALEAGVTINLDALHEMERLEAICREKGKKVRISFRVNPAVDPKTHPHLSTGLKESKFGIPSDKVLEAYGRAKESGHFDIAGIHMHIGSQITITSPYEEATAKLFDLIGRLKNDQDLDLDFVDLGGGVGIRYEENTPYITPADLAGAIVPVIKDKISEYGLKEPTLYFEPGRFIVGDAGVMLTRVSTIKKSAAKKFIGTDAGFHVLARPTLYGSHHDVVVANRAGEPPAEEVDIAGNVCESGDILARGRQLPKIHTGDVLAFLDAGAYGFIMASQYNSRPRPAEVLVHDGGHDLIREAETFDDLTRHQKVPERLRKV